MRIWILVLACAVIGIVLLRLAYAMGRRRSMKASLAKGVFFHALLKPGEKVWCRMSGGHVYEIEYLHTAYDQRFYRLTRLSVDVPSGQVVERVHPKSFFCHADLKVGDCFMCIPDPGRTTPIFEISITPLEPVLRTVEEDAPRKTFYSEQAR